MLAEPLATLASYIESGSWPPYYERFCDPMIFKCESIGSTAGTAHYTTLMQQTLQFDCKLSPDVGGPQGH